MIYALIVSDILIVGSFIFKFSSLPPQLPLFYSRSWGEDQLAEYWYIFILPLFLHAFIFLNIYIYNQLFFPDRLIRRIVDYINWFHIIGFTFIFLKIIFLVS